MIDTHCHLSFPDFNADRAAVIQRAADAGVVGFVSVATEPEDWYRTLDMAEMYPAIRVAVGVHPNHAQAYTPSVGEELRKVVKNKRVVGIGETGLDFYRDTAPREKQYESFQMHLAVAADANLPFILHCRNAENEMLEVLAAERARINRPLRGVWHCFTASQEHARRAMDLDLYFGLGGIVTFPKSTAIREAIALIPENRLLLETDCPFLSPQGFRNQRRNEPSFMTSIVTTLAEIRRKTTDEIRCITTENARALFGNW